MVSKLTMNSPCTHWVITPLSPVSRNQGNLILGQLIDVALVALYVVTMATKPSLQAVHLPLDNVVPLPQVAHQLLIISRKGGVELVHLFQLCFQLVRLEKPSEKES